MVKDDPTGAPGVSEDRKQYLIDESVELLKYKFQKYGDQIVQAFKQTDPAKVLLDEAHMELHFANIMVNAKFIVEADPQAHQAEGMQEILKKLSSLASTYMKQRKQTSINIQTAAALIATFIKRGGG